MSKTNKFLIMALKLNKDILLQFDLNCYIFIYFGGLVKTSNQINVEKLTICSKKLQVRSI